MCPRLHSKKICMGLQMSTKMPLVVILGSTGSGKTKLSLELTQRFGGEIIGADSMQTNYIAFSLTSANRPHFDQVLIGNQEIKEVPKTKYLGGIIDKFLKWHPHIDYLSDKIYRDLDITSAKATKEELSMAPHHMINILEPYETFSVLEYRNKVLPIIESLLEWNKLPVVVGGTNYYIESLLWKILVQDPGEEVSDCGVLPHNEHKLSSQELHKKLKTLDPVMANRLHPNNKRKILRALEVLHQKGKKFSEILAENQKGGSTSGGGLRYDNVVVLWLECNQEILDKRLDDRVDKMIEQGLLDELINFHKLYNEERTKDNRKPDYTKGIFQSIGFKEFYPYLMLSAEERKTRAGIKTFQESIERLKIATRRYARKQTKWTVNRFLGRKDRQVPPMYGLDTSDVSKWNENVTTPSYSIVHSYISKTKCDIQPLPMRDVNSVANALDETYNCEVCNRVFVGKLQWEIHKISRKHKKVSQKVKKSNDKSVVTSG